MYFVLGGYDARERYHSDVPEYEKIHHRAHHPELDAVEQIKVFVVRADGDGVQQVENVLVFGPVRPVGLVQEQYRVQRVKAPGAQHGHYETAEEIRDPDGPAAALAQHADAFPALPAGHETVAGHVQQVPDLVGVAREYDQRRHGHEIVQLSERELEHGHAMVVEQFGAREQPRKPVHVDQLQHGGERDDRHVINVPAEYPFAVRVEQVVISEILEQCQIESERAIVRSARRPHLPILRVVEDVLVLTPKHRVFVYWTVKSEFS